MARNWMRDATLVVLVLPSAKILTAKAPRRVNLIEIGFFFVTAILLGKYSVLSAQFQISEVEIFLAGKNTLPLPKMSCVWLYWAYSAQDRSK